MGALGAIVVAILVRMAVGAEMQVHIQQPNSEVYHRQDMKKGEFDYGYHVQSVENNQFQHKVKGPDDVTYGCYGYVDPSNRKHLVYYVADKMGYRIIFPNRPTKIFTARLADSLNKLDGSVKGKDYDENVVEWNNLYMPESCFRLNEILDSAASNQAPVQKVAPPQPRGQPQQPQQSWQGSLPDINPAHINLDQFNGHVYPIHTGAQVYEEHGSGGHSTHTTTTTTTAAGGQFSQYGLNITQLLAQIEAVNSQVITLNMLLAGMANNPTAYSNANENTCRSVVQLLQTQKRTPQLIYVPILIPYTEGQYNINQPIAAASKPVHEQRAGAYRG
uniref:Uncharacterized protein n=1 Tax=Anopheles dirus TaxID=7168 RepID=A0A182MY33_9DIPT